MASTDLSFFGVSFWVFEKTTSLVIHFFNTKTRSTRKSTKGRTLFFVSFRVLRAFVLKKGIPAAPIRAIQIDEFKVVQGRCAAWTRCPCREVQQPRIAGGK